MKKHLFKRPAEAGGSFELGSTLGQRKAFGMIAGRCSAAEAAAIRRLREERLYEASSLPWKEFCPRHLGMCRAQADRLIGYLEEFGPDYFELTQLTRIPADEYRAIAPAVKDGHIYWQNQAIALLPENNDKVAAAVTSLRAALKPPQPAAAAPAETPTALGELQRRTDQLVGDWTNLVARRIAMPHPEKQSMKNAIGKARLALHRLESQVWA